MRRVLYYLNGVLCKCIRLCAVKTSSLLISPAATPTAYAWVCVSYYNCVLPQSSRRSLSAASGNRAATSAQPQVIQYVLNVPPRPRLT